MFILIGKYKYKILVVIHTIQRIPQKLLIGILAGFLIDLFIRLVKDKKNIKNSEKEIVTNNYYIVNNLTSLTNKYVLTLSNNNTKLNEIFIKMYNKWYRKNFSRLYSTKMNDFYYKAKNIDEKDKSNFKGKKYILKEILKILNDRYFLYVEE